MKQTIHVGLIGDHDPTVTAHVAIPDALQLAARASEVTVRSTWVPTGEIVGMSRVSGYDGLWAVPATPYRSMDGALIAIQHARENRVPFLGTCGGFQHAIIEYARNVLGWADADHAETAPDAARAVISPLSCSLVEVTGTIRLRPRSRIAGAYRAAVTTEEYHCRYGLNPLFREALASGPLQIGAVDSEGDVRAVELEGHPFYIATLFQPERAALSGTTPPLVVAFIRSCASGPGETA